MNEKEIIFETTKLDCGCEYVLNDYEQIKLIFCDEHMYEKYSVGDFAFLNEKNVNQLQEYFDKISEMKLWYFIDIKKKRGRKRKIRRWRFIEKEFRPLFKYFKKKYRFYNRYKFRRYLKKMKRIKKLGWSKYVKISIEKERMKKEKKFGGINNIVGIIDVEVDDEEEYEEDEDEEI